MARQYRHRGTSGQACFAAALFAISGFLLFTVTPVSYASPYLPVS